MQFLSYEGVFTAINGAAVGITSTDIDVFESSSTEVGYSLQLGGTGNTYEDFSWNIPEPSTFSNINAGQKFTSSTISEPKTLALLVLGFTGIFFLKRKKWLS